VYTQICVYTPVGSGWWDGGVVPAAVGSWVGLFGPWGGSSRTYVPHPVVVWEVVVNTD